MAYEARTRSNELRESEIRLKTLEFKLQKAKEDARREREALTNAPEASKSQTNVLEDPNLNDSKTAVNAAKLTNEFAHSKNESKNEALDAFKGKQDPLADNYVLPNGAKYTGDYFGKKPHGKGTMILPDGSTYIGDFEDGKFHGYGTFNHSNGSKYIGQWQAGFMHGHGAFFFTKGHKYEKYVGDFRNHQLCGQGTLSMPNGVKWEGEFRDNEMNGWGTMTYQTGVTDRVLYINSKYIRTAE